MRLGFGAQMWLWKGPAPWPKDGAYIVAIKAWVRRAEQLDLGDLVDVVLEISPG